MKVLSVVAIVLIVLALVVVGPLVTIWALNLLFGFSIPMNFYTWVATLWLGGLIQRPKANFQKTS